MGKQKLLLGAVLLGLVSTAFADGTLEFKRGVVLGVQGGYGRPYEGEGFEKWAHESINNYYSTNRSVEKIKQWNFAGRGYVGYSFAPYLTLEGGYDYYWQERYQASGANAFSHKSLDARVNVDAYDLMAKLTLPLGLISDEFAGYGVFVRGGAAYVHTKIDGNYSGSYGATTQPVAFDQVSHVFRPAYGAGLSYNFTDEIALEASWLGFYGRNKLEFVPQDLSATNPSAKLQVTNLDKVVPYSNMFVLGLSYKISGIF